MSGTKRDSSHIDDDNSNDNDQLQPSISSSSYTPANSPQNPIYISSTPPVESAMSTPASTGAHPTETSIVTRKRRRKDESEPDYTAAMMQKKNKSRRVAQACDRCHVSY